MSENPDSPIASLPTSSLDRRSLMIGASATIIGTQMAWTGNALAQASPPSAHTFKVGAAEVTVLTDGTMAMPFSFVLPGRPRNDIESVFARAGRKLADPGVLQVNVVLIRLGNQLILVDSGAGPDFAPARGKLGDSLVAAGIKPEAITTVVFTHAHPDHLWGVSDPFDGASIFTRARHVITAAERDYWLHPDTAGKVP